jgi:hypothetical protein
MRAMVYGRDSKQVTEGKVAAALFHKPCDRLTTGCKFATNQLIEKNAA